MLSREVETVKRENEKRKALHYEGLDCIANLARALMSEQASKNDEIAARQEEIIEQEEKIAEQQNQLAERELELQAQENKYSILKSLYE